MISSMIDNDNDAKEEKRLQGVVNETIQPEQKAGGGGEEVT